MKQLFHSRLLDTRVIMSYPMRPRGIHVIVNYIKQGPWRTTGITPCWGLNLYSRPGMAGGLSSYPPVVACRLSNPGSSELERQ